MNVVILNRNNSTISTIVPCGGHDGRIMRAGCEGLVVWVGCGSDCEGCVGCLFVLRAPMIPVELLGPQAQVHQKIGNQRHIRDRRKALDETNQTITFN
jgi:hypothetical protein